MTTIDATTAATRRLRCPATACASGRRPASRCRARRRRWSTAWSSRATTCGCGSRTDAWREAGLALRDVVGCDYFCFLSAHRLDAQPVRPRRGRPHRAAARARHRDRAGLHRRRHPLPGVRPGHQHRRSTSASRSRPTCPTTRQSCDSWVPVYAGANWHERETHEMFGIGFAGHPDLRNMYLPTDFEGYPLRKDFPLLGAHREAVAGHRRRRAAARRRRRRAETDAEPGAVR